MTKCQKCGTGRFDAAGNCKYCASMREKIQPGRTDMKPALQAYTLSVGALIAAYLVRIGLFTYNMSLWGALESGDLDAFHRHQNLAALSRLSCFAIAIAGFAHTRTLMRWLHTGHANALTRPEVGLRWFRAMPSSRLFRRWGMATTATVLVSLVLAFALSDPHDPQAMRLWNVVQIVAGVMVVVLAVGEVAIMRKLTGELLARLDAPAAPAVEETVAEPEPVL